jgi:hypothetical protein
MASPITPQPLVTFPSGPGGSPDNVTGLPNGQAKGLGRVGTTLVQAYNDLVAPIQIKSGPSLVSASGSVTFYVVCSEDGTHWSGGVDPTSAADQSAKLAALSPLGPSIAMVANATTYTFLEFSIRVELDGFMPTYWSVIIYNQSGAAFDATAANHIAQHTLVNYA